MKRVLVTSLLALGTAIGAAQPAMAAYVFPTAVNGQNSLTYGDFTVYSTAFLNYYATNKTSAPSKGDPYYIPSGPGRISDYIVVGTGAGGIDNSEFANTDDPFDTSIGGSTDTFETTAGNEPTPVVANDTNGRWDVSIDTLRTYLDGSDLYIMFNLNETKGGRSLTGNPEDVLAYAEITLTDADGILDPVTFYFNGYNPDPTLQTATLFDDGSSATPWGHVHGQICVTSTSEPSAPDLLHLGACDGSEAVDAKTLDQNLGADRAAFALFNEQLNALVLSSGYDTLSGYIKLGDMNNGYEQIFLLANRDMVVPEPATLGLMGAGLLGLGWARRRRRG